MRKNSVVPVAVTGILLAAVILVPVPGRARWVGQLHDFAHAPIFGCIAVALLLWIRSAMPEGSSWPRWRSYFVAFTGAATLGVLTEIIQFIAGRDASWIDTRSDVLGAAAFLALFAAFDQAFRSGMRIVLALMGIALLAWHARPAVETIAAYRHRADLHPTLAEFNGPVDLYFVRARASRVQIGPLPAPWATAPQSALHVVFSEERWPGVDFFEPVPDWTIYRTLVLDLVNPTGVELGVTLRVHDAHHNNEYADRFNRAFALAPRSRRAIRIPLEEIASAPQGRRMDLKQVADFHLFRSHDSHAHEMYIVAVTLEL